MRAGVTAFSPQPVMTTGPMWVYKFAIYTLSVGFNMFSGAAEHACHPPGVGPRSGGNVLPPTT